MLHLILVSCVYVTEYFKIYFIKIPIEFHYGGTFTFKPVVGYVGRTHKILSKIKSLTMDGIMKLVNELGYNHFTIVAYLSPKKVREINFKEIGLYFVEIEVNV